MSLWEGGGAVSIEVLMGLPGSGKSSRLIERVNQSRDSGRPVATFESIESAKLRADEYVTNHRIIGCRRPGLLCRLDYLVSTAEAGQILRSLSAETVAAFEEAFYFGEEIAHDWIEASERGVEIILATPSPEQHRVLRGADINEVHLSVLCEECGRQEATTFALASEGGATIALCASCQEALAAAARQEIVDRLERETPYPGERVIYQPVEIEECADWQVLRPDSERRAAVMIEALSSLELTARPPGRLSYLDVGCNTGFFCHTLQRVGFHATGVDVTPHNVELARLLTSFVRRDTCMYTLADCYEYLEAAQGMTFDVTSSFSVFQWLMIQRTVQHGIEALERLFAITGAVCFLEMGYSEEDHYKDSLDVDIDRDWVASIMVDRGDFADVFTIDAADHGLMRDLFIGVKESLGDARARLAEVGAAPVLATTSAHARAPRVVN
jgi:SAM-dependent methyltransferase/thymidine kinase